MKSQPTRGEIVIMVGGLAVVIGSFLPFYSLPAGFESPTAWDSGLSPIALYPLFAGVASAGVVALRRFADGQLTIRRGGYSWEQIHVLLGLFALLIAVGYFFGSKPVGWNYGLGYWALLGGSIALLVGGVMHSREHSGPRGIY